MNKGFKTINLILGLAAIILGTWLVKIWSLPVEIPTLKDTEIEVLPEVTRERAILPSSSYNIIVEKDLFRSSRKRYVAKVKPPAPPPPPPPPPPSLPPPPPPPKRPIPKFTLYGTVILEESEGEDIAIISTNMQSRKPSSYNTGDSIEEGFVLTEIHNNKVVVKRDEDGEIVEVSFKTPSVSPVRPGTRRPVIPRPQQERRQRRNGRRRNGGASVLPTFPELPPPLKSGNRSPPQSKGEPEHDSKVIKHLMSLPSLSTQESPSSTAPKIPSQPLNGSKDDAANNDSDIPSKPPSEESGKIPQEEGNSDIPSPSSEDANKDEMPPPIPSE